MGEAEIALVRRVYADWGSGDYSHGEYLHPDFELVFARGFLDEGVHSGWAEAWKGWKNWVDQWASWDYRPVGWTELPDGRVVVYLDIDGVSRTTGLRLALHTANVWEIEDGLVRRVTLYAHREDMERDLGLESS